MKYLVTIEGHRRAAFIRGERSHGWLVFYITRDPVTPGVVGRETAKLQIPCSVAMQYGLPIPGKTYEVEYGPNDTLTSYVLHSEE